MVDIGKACYQYCQGSCKYTERKEQDSFHRCGFFVFKAELVKLSHAIPPGRCRGEGTR